MITKKKEPNPLLIINRSDSSCANCNRGADPNEKQHKTIVEYGPINSDPGPGCGIEWKYVTSGYMGSHAKTATITLRPDLEWHEIW